VIRTIWLASYPKSGNTWFRMLVANLSANDGKAVDINNLPERGGLAGARAPFDYLTLLDSGLLTHDEIDDLRPRVYEALARGDDDDEYDKAPDVPLVRPARCGRLRGLPADHRRYRRDGHLAVAAAGGPGGGARRGLTGHRGGARIRRGRPLAGRGSR